MGWKLLYIVTAWPLICVVALLGLIYRSAEWAHDELALAGVRWTKFCGVKVDDA